MRIGIEKKVALAVVLASCFVGTGYGAELRTQVVAHCPNEPGAPPQGAELLTTLAAILIPQIFSAGVDMAATALNEAAKDKKVSFIADSDTFNMYKLAANGDLNFNGDVGCVIVYMPAPKDEKQKPAPAATPAWFKKVIDSKVTELIELPDIYAEFKVRHVDPNSTKLILIPRLLAVHRQLQDGLTRKKQRGYAFALSFKDDASLTSYGDATFAFDDIAVGAWTQDGRHETKIAPWPLNVSIPKMPKTDEILTAIAAQKSSAAPYRSANALLRQQYQVTHPTVKDAPPEGIFDPEYVTALDTMCKALDAANATKGAAKVSDARCPASVFVAKRNFATATDKVNLKVGAAWAKQFLLKTCDKNVDQQDGLTLCQLPAPRVAELGYSVVSVSVTEVAEATEFVQGLAKVFSGKKEDIKTALNDKFNPARREELEQAAATKETDTRNAYRVTLMNVEQIQAQLQEASDKSESFRATIRTQLAQAKIAANKAALAAGLAIPYPEFD